MNSIHVIYDVMTLAPAGAIQLSADQLLVTHSGFHDACVAFTNWAQSPEGVSLSFASFLLGVFLSVARNAPKPLLCGIAIAGAISVGPLLLSRL